MMIDNNPYISLIFDEILDRKAAIDKARKKTDTRATEKYIIQLNTLRRLLNECEYQIDLTTDPPTIKHVPDGYALIHDYEVIT